MSSLEPASYARAVYDSLRAALKAEGREDLLADVMEELVALARGNAPTTADVTSAVELSAAQRAKAASLQDVLIILANDVPAWFSRFTRVAELVGAAEEDKTRGR